MERRRFLKASAAAGLSLAGMESLCTGQVHGQGKGRHTMKAGFARVSITPPVGTTMMGFGGRDMDHGCEGTHDDIYARALFLEHEGEQVLIMAFDLCFIGREETDRFKAAIGRIIDLSPRQILLNTSHNHVGPSVGTWYSAGYEAQDRLYMNDLEQATVRAACEARDAMKEVTLWSGLTHSKLPMNRRKKMPDGSIQNRPNPKDRAYDRLPICMLKDTVGEPVCLLFSISTHPSMMSGYETSAEYPGVAMRLLDKHFGSTCSLFLQGVGGDSKPLVIGEGQDTWKRGTWELMEKAGAMIAGEAIAAIDAGLEQVEPDLCAASVEMEWALEPTPPKDFFEKIVDDTDEANRAKDVKFMWARHILKRLARGDTLPTSVTLSAHGVKLGKDLRILGIEGEAVGEWGYIIEKFYGDGVTFPLGYTDGTGLYLPVTKMLPEGGYEVISYWEYGLPSGLAPGMEKAVQDALNQLRARGIA
jgi:hypothetical protein